MPEYDLQSNALGSAAAGIISRCLTHPLDTAKAKLQALPTTTSPLESSSSSSSPKSNSRKVGVNRNGTYNLLRSMARTEGIASWYRGFGAVLVGGTPGTILYLCSYDIIKNRLNEAASSDDDTTSRQDSFAVYLASGMLAEAIACIIYVPVDVVKERMQVQSSTTSISSTRLPYKSSWDALITISKQEGLSGIYKGYGATMTSFGPFSALYFVFYEDLKRRSLEYYSYYNNDKTAKEGDLPLPWIICSSATAGALASFLTSPLDMAKLRLQVQRGTLASTSTTAAATMTAAEVIPTIQYRGMVDCLSQVFQREGIPGLFRGAGARVLHFVPATTITMTCYESCRSFFYKTLNP